MAKLDKADPAHEHLLTEALWVHQYQDVDDAAARPGARLARFPRPRRRHPCPVLLARPCPQRPRSPQEAGRRPYPGSGSKRSAASFFTVPEAIEVALISADHPTDEYLDYTWGETMKAPRKPHGVQGSPRRRPADPGDDRRRLAVLPRPALHRRTPQDEAVAGSRPRTAPPQGGPRRGPKGSSHRPGQDRRQARAEGPARRHQGPRRPTRRR